MKFEVVSRHRESQCSPRHIELRLCIIRPLLTLLKVGVAWKKPDLNLDKISGRGVIDLILLH